MTYLQVDEEGTVVSNCKTIFLGIYLYLFLDCGRLFSFFLAVYGSCPDGFSTQPPDHKPSAPRSRRTLPKNPNPSSSKCRQIPKIKINDNDEDESKL